MSKKVEFKAYTEFGKFDVADWIFPYEVTDEEYELLKTHYKEFTPPGEIEELSDLMEKITEAAVIYSTNDFLSNDYDLVEDYINEAIEDGEIESEEEWRSDMVYRIWVDWPVKW